MDPNLSFDADEYISNKQLNISQDNIIINKEKNDDLLINTNPIMQNKLINDNKKDELQFKVPKVQILKIKAPEKTKKQLLLEEERKTKDYSKLGVSFSLSGVSINDTDSPKMVALKTALSEYLKTKERLFQKNKKLSEEEQGTVGPKLIYEQHASGAYAFNVDAYKAAVRNKTGLKDDQLEELREAYHKAYMALTDYMAGKCIWFKIGRGRARLKQAKAIEDMLQADNREYNLSELRKDLSNSMDARLHDPSMGIFPNYLGVVRNKDYIDKRHAKLRKEGRNSSLHIGWYGALLKDAGNVLMGAWHLIGGTAFRLTAVPTMLALNGLELVGKTSKILLKGFAETLNFLSFGKLNWKIKVNKRTLSHGWTTLDRARQFNVAALKVALCAPVYTFLKTPIHSLCRFVANRFRDKEDQESQLELIKNDFRTVTNFYKSDFTRLFTYYKSNLRSFVGLTKPIEDRGIQDVYMASKAYDDPESLEIDNNYESAKFNVGADNQDDDDDSEDDE